MVLLKNKIILVSVILILCGGVILAILYYTFLTSVKPRYVDRSLNSGLVLYFHFNNELEYGENGSYVHDFSNNGNDGIVSGAKWDGLGGRWGDGAFVFNGTNDSLEVRDVDALSPSSSGQHYSVSYFAKFTNGSFVGDGSGKDYSNFMGKGSFDEGYEWNFRLYNSSNSEGRNDRISFYAFNKIGGLGAGSYFQQPLGNDWVYVTGVIDGGKIKIYENGILKSSSLLSTYNIHMENGGANFYIGKISGVNYFYGSIDELRIYSRSLSDREVERLYNYSIEKGANYG